MKSLNYGVVAIAVLGISGCATIDQKIRPISQISNDEVCIIENPKVQPGFLNQFKKTLEENGYKHKILPENSGFKDCNIISIYTANWAWDLALYMAYAKISVYQAGQPLGNAVYDARKAGLNSDKFVRGMKKWMNLSASCFPNNPDMVNGKRREVRSRPTVLNPTINDKTRQQQPPVGTFRLRTMRHPFQQITNLLQPN